MSSFHKIIIYIILLIRVHFCTISVGFQKSLKEVKNKIVYALRLYLDLSFRAVLMKYLFKNVLWKYRTYIN